MTLVANDIPNPTIKSAHLGTPRYRSWRELSGPIRYDLLEGPIVLIRFSVQHVVTPCRLRTSRNVTGTLCVL